MRRSDIEGGTPQESCSACGAQSIAGLPFCPACGKRLREPEEGRQCSRCGTPATDDRHFCAACGLDLTVRPSVAVRGPLSPFSLTLINEAGEDVQNSPLAMGDTTVGRLGADIDWPDDPFLSPVHARFSVEEGALMVRDLGSRNGTWCFGLDPHRLLDGDRVLIGSQILLYKRLGYPGPHPPERDATRRLGSLVPSADIARVSQLRSDGSQRDAIHLSPGRDVVIGREQGDWVFPYDPSMSGRHAVIRSEDADFILEDLGSRNGVALAARGAVELVPGRCILVGDKMLRVDSA
jgi:pSer/pThr/pTyr-binding forkhead associated (FHA) protein